MSFEDLLKRPQTKMISTLECIGNTVGGFSIGTAEWEGVTLNHLLDEAGFDPKNRSEYGRRKNVERRDTTTKALTPYLDTVEL